MDICCIAFNLRNAFVLGPLQWHVWGSPLGPKFHIPIPENMKKVPPTTLGMHKTKLPRYDGNKLSTFYGLIPKTSSPTPSQEEHKFLVFRKRLELSSLSSDRMFKLYLRLSDTITDIIKEPSVLKKVREIECQLLKLLMLTTNTLDEARNERLARTQNTSQENLDSLLEVKPGTQNVRRRRAFQQSTVDPPTPFDRFKINDSFRRLEMELGKIPEIMEEFPIKNTNLTNTALQNQLEQSRMSGKYLVEELKIKCLRIYSLIQEVDTLKGTVSCLQAEIKVKKEENESFKRQIERGQSGPQYKEMWQMCSEEVVVFQSVRLDLERELKHLRRKYKIQKERLNGSIQNKETFLFEGAKQEMEDIKYLIAELKASCKPTLEETGQLSTFPHKLPSVLSLFESDKLKESELNFFKNKTLSSDLFLKLRGVMDSKYFEFWSTQDTKGITSLPDFCMGFMDKFCIEPNYKKVALHGLNSESVEKLKLEFLMDVSSSKLKDVIEVSIFKEFLFEERARDELFFYLSCRHVLFNGPVLDNIICSQDPILFVPLDRALKVIDQILINFDRSLIDKIKGALNLKRKKKAHKFFVDGHFLLRALLELYALEKKKKLNVFRKSLLNNDPSCKSVTFKGWRKFMNKNYPFVTNADLVQVYRNCWRWTKGDFNVEVIFNMCDWILVQELKDQTFIPKRFHNHYKEDMQRVESHFEEGKYFSRRLHELGLEKLFIQANKAKQLLSMKTRDCLNTDAILGLISIVDLPKNIKIIEILSSFGTTKASKHSTSPQLDFCLDYFCDLTQINKKYEQHRKKMREAAGKIGLYFDQRIKTLYKRFGADINKELVGISMVV